MEEEEEEGEVRTISTRRRRSCSPVSVATRAPRPTGSMVMYGYSKEVVAMDQFLGYAHLPVVQQRATVVSGRQAGEGPATTAWPVNWCRRWRLTHSTRS